MSGFRIALGGSLAALVLGSACVTAPTSAAPSVAPGVAAGPVASPSPAALATAGARNVSSAGAAQTPALPPATTDVSPSQVQIGSITLSMTLEPARHMLAQAAAMTSDPDPAHQSSASGPSMGSSALVLDGLLQLTNNIDPSQPLPDDQPQSMIRHVNVQVHNSDGANYIPYLSASLDMLLDGHPAVSNVALPPMVASESATPQVYYGNNLKLMQRGTYQVFVRLQRSVLLGKDTPPPAQFNVDVR